MPPNRRRSCSLERAEITASPHASFQGFDCQAAYRPQLRSPQLAEAGRSRREPHGGLRAPSGFAHEWRIRCPDRRWQRHHRHWVQQAVSCSTRRAPSPMRRRVRAGLRRRGPDSDSSRARWRHGLEVHDEPACRLHAARAMTNVQSSGCEPRKRRHRPKRTGDVIGRHARIEVWYSLQRRADPAEPGRPGSPGVFDAAR